MKKIIIDHERYGNEAMEFKSLEEAEGALRKCFRDDSIEFHERMDNRVVDDRGDVVGSVEED